jgi:hypothetical protein
MTANFPGREKGAGAIPLAIFQAGGIGIMFSPELYTKLGEGNSIGLLRVTLRFLNFPNQAGLHGLPPQYNQKALRSY